MSDRCPNSPTLLAFLAGELAAEEDAAVALHMQDCAACDQLAQNMSGDNEARRLLRHRLAEDCTDGGISLGELRGRLAALAMLTAERSALASGLTSTCGAVDTSVELPPAKSPVIPRKLSPIKQI